MYIIKEGDLNKLKKFKYFKCPKCGCEVVADNTEYTDCSTQREGPMFQVMCPTCSNWAMNYSYDYVLPPCKL